MPRMVTVSARPPGRGCRADRSRVRTAHLRFYIRISCTPRSRCLDRKTIVHSTVDLHHAPVTVRTLVNDGLQLLEDGRECVLVARCGLPANATQGQVRRHVREHSMAMRFRTPES